MALYPTVSVDGPQWLIAPDDPPELSKYNDGLFIAGADQAGFTGYTYDLPMFLDSTWTTDQDEPRTFPRPAALDGFWIEFYLNVGSPTPQIYMEVLVDGVQVWDYGYTNFAPNPAGAWHVFGSHIGYFDPLPADVFVTKPVQIVLWWYSSDPGDPMVDVGSVGLYFTATPDEPPPAPTLSDTIDRGNSLIAECRPVVGLLTGDVTAGGG